MLPLLCGAALYFHNRQDNAALQTGPTWTVLLWVASFLMAATGAYEIGKRTGLLP
jgi:hypothetical protein